MRHLIVVATFFILAGAMPCAVQYIPPGDYVQTCRDIRTYGNHLDAECQRRDGSWRRTGLDNIDRCMSGIVNDDGHLICANAGDYGYYQNGWRDGRRDGWRDGLPYGDYVQTCRDIRVYGDRLEAECQKRNGDWRRTSLDHVDQCSSPIANDNGRLVCGRGGYGYNPGWQRGIPAGTYTQTCRDIRVYGNRLEAECQKRNGGWRQTALDNIDQCRSAPANDNGHLVCGR